MFRYGKGKKTIVNKNEGKFAFGLPALAAFRDDKDGYLGVGFGSLCFVFHFTLALSLIPILRHFDSLLLSPRNKKLFKLHSLAK